MGAARRYLSVALILYGAVGVAVHLRLLPLLVGGLGAWLGLPSPSSAPPRLDLLGPLQAHFEQLGKYTDADIHNLYAFLVTLK